MILGNIYTPNEDNLSFKKSVLSHLLSFECEEIILGCFFNLVLDVQNDKKGARLTTNKNSLKEVQNIRNSLDLIDVCRVSNPGIKRFTWGRSKPEIHCRLDFFLTINSVSSAITKPDILPGYKTDNFLITLYLANNKEFTIEDDAVCPGGRVAPGHLYVNDVTINHFRRRR